MIRLLILALFLIAAPASAEVNFWLCAAPSTGAPAPLCDKDLGVGSLTVNEGDPVTFTVYGEATGSDPDFLQAKFLLNMSFAYWANPGTPPICLNHRGDWSAPGNHSISCGLTGAEYSGFVWPMMQYIDTATSSYPETNYPEYLPFDVVPTPLASFVMNATRHEFFSGLTLPITLPVFLNPSFPEHQNTTGVQMGTVSINGGLAGCCQSLIKYTGKNLWVVTINP